MSESFPFLGFSLAVILAYYASRAPGWRRVVILVANVVFLGTFFSSVQSAIPFLAFLACGYCGLVLIQRGIRGAFLPALIGTLILFIWLKKYAFVPSGSFLRFAYVTVGLSYILFRALHLMIDARSGAISRKIGFVSYFNYTAGFTTLVSGPIQQFQDWELTEDPASRPPLTREIVLSALERIVRGLFKTNVLALLLSTFHTAMLDRPGILPTALMLVSYPLFIYCNFAGYIDIVIGVAQLLGTTLPENFMRPFSSDNIMELWGSRWHITLSAWLRTYVYNPLLLALMRRNSSSRMEPYWAVLAFFVTFFLIGVWHGQTSEFLFFGLVLGLGVSVNKIYQIVMMKRMGRKRYNAMAKDPVYVALARGFTFTWFTFTTIWFWSNWHQIGALGGALGWRLIPVWLLIFAGATIVLATWEAIYQRGLAAATAAPPVYTLCLKAALATAAIVMTIATGILMNQAAPEIVYKAF